jgi:hypothetical protein
MSSEAVHPLKLHPELIAARRSIALASDKLRAIQDEGLRLKPFVDRDEIPKPDAVDALCDAARSNGLYMRHRCDDIEHVIGQGLAGREALMSERPRAEADAIAMSQDRAPRHSPAALIHSPKRANGSRPNERPEPDMRLVHDDRPSAPTLEDDALPAGWGPWIAAEAAARGCPRDYVAASLIGATSAWIGNARRVAATADWSEPPHLWFALVGAPSAGKTPAQRAMTEASDVLEREAEPAWQEALARYERDAEAALAADKTWRDAVRNATKSSDLAPDRPASAEAPTKPPRPRVMAMDSSTEELQRLLADNCRGLLFGRDELAGWLGGFDRYGGAGADRAFYLEAWNGGPYVCDRVRYHGEPVRIEHAALAILCGMVPDRLRDALAGADDGLAARFVYVWPEMMPIAPLANHADAEAAQRRNTLMTAARGLRGLTMGMDDRSQPAPRALRLDKDGLMLFDELRRDAMARARSTHGLSAGWHGKTPGRALRLALVYEMLAWAARGGPEPANVLADAVARAGGYLDYAAGMLDRVLGGIAIGRAEADAAVIARHLLATHTTRLNERELYQTAGFAWARNRERRNAALGVLEAAFWIRRTQVGDHGRPRGDWDVSRSLAEQATQ